MTSGNHAVFLDRDGVINVDYGYVSRSTDFDFIPGVIEGLRRFQDHGFKLIVITNQSGIARGIYTSDDYYRLTEYYCTYLSAHGVFIDGVYHCPHHPQYTSLIGFQKCDCRKPQPGLIYKASIDHNISLYRSLMIGDKASDVLAAYHAGIPTRFLVSSNSNVIPPTLKDISFSTCSSLLQCAQSVL